MAARVQAAGAQPDSGPEPLHPRHLRPPVPDVRLRRARSAAASLDIPAQQPAEALHDLGAEGTTVAETHVAEDNAAALQLFTKLGFQATDHGTVFRR